LTLAAAATALGTWPARVSETRTRPPTQPRTRHPIPRLAQRRLKPA